MEKVAYIGAAESGLYLEIKGIGKSGETYRTRTNKEEKLENIL